MDSERITEIYEAITKYTIALEPDPASLGPKYLSEIIARCRNYLNATHMLVLEVHREKHLVQRELTALEAAYDIESADLLANDDRVRRLPNIDDRKATVSVILRDRLRAVQELRGIIEDLEIVDKAIRFRHRELKDTMAEIKVQRSLIRDELDTKSFYGDERTSDTHGGGDGGLNVAELENLLNEAANEALGTTVPDAAKDVEDFPVTGLLCSICNKPQYDTPSGPTCGEHGGADGVEPEDAEPVVSETGELTDADFDAILQNV